MDVFPSRHPCSHRYGLGTAERGEGGVGGGEQVGCGGEALDEGAGGGELPVSLCGAVSGLPAFRGHITPETLHPVPHARVEPACPRQAPLSYPRRWETGKRGEAEQLWKEHGKTPKVSF